MKPETWLKKFHSFSPTLIKMGLERVKTIYQTLIPDTFACPIVTVAGTNGKGTTVRNLEQLMTQQGLNVGAYYSPHLIHFNERIQINGQCIDDETLCHCFEVIAQHDPLNQLTYFEFITLAALFYFKSQPLDLIILEVGLGGRLDAVNCVDPNLAIITAVGLDHCDQLGHSLESIGYEKAGIFRPGIPVILGQEAILSSVIDQADKLNVLLYQSGKDFNWVDNLQDCWHINKTIYSRSVKSDFSENDLIAMASSKILADIYPKLFVKESHFEPIKTQLPGRFNIFDNPRHFKTVLDVAHNAHGTLWLAKKLKQIHPKGKVIAVWSSFKDKDLTALIEPLIPLVTHWFISELCSERKANLQLLASALSNFNVHPFSMVQDIKLSYSAAQCLAEPNDIILIFGSFETVEILLPLVKKECLTQGA